MYTTVKRQNRQEKVISSLNAAIVVLDVAQKASSITPAAVAFSIAKEVLTVVRVCFPFFSVARPRAEIPIGHHGEQGRLRRSRTRLRQCVRGPRPRVEREATERAKQLGMRGDQALDSVSYVPRAVVNSEQLTNDSPPMRS